jgi:TPR repeat protein
MLGQCYELGIGGPEDRAGAIRLYKLAQAAGSQNAAARLARLGAP